MFVGLDFDGTVVTHDFPDIGKDIGAISWLLKIQEAGGRIILNTMRSGESLVAAVKFLEDQGVELYGVNQNPSQASWTASPKVYAHVYIDDAAFGCPLIFPVDGKRPYVDWNIVGPGILEKLKNK